MRFLIWGSRQSFHGGTYRRLLKFEKASGYSLLKFGLPLSESFSTNEIRRTGTCPSGEDFVDGSKVHSWSWISPSVLVHLPWEKGQFNLRL